MSYFVVNHSRKEIYRLSHWRETFDDVIDANPTWTMKDDVECYEDDVEIVGNLLRLDYSTNIQAHELPIYIRDPEFLVWYMDSHEYGTYDISKIVNSWTDSSTYEKAQDAFDDLLDWKKNKNDSDVDMLCEKMQTAM